MAFDSNDAFKKYLHFEWTQTHTPCSVDPREQKKDMQSTWGVDSVPFLSFMSSSSVVLQLSVDPCDMRERERQYARWRGGYMKVGRPKKKYRNRFADRVYKPCGTIYGAHTVNQQTHTHKESPASTDIPQHTLTHTDSWQEHTEPCTNQPTKHEGKTHSLEWYLWSLGLWF